MHTQLMVIIQWSLEAEFDGVRFSDGSTKGNNTGRNWHPTKSSRSHWLLGRRDFLYVNIYIYMGKDDARGKKPCKLFYLYIHYFPLSFQKCHPLMYTAPLSPCVFDVCFQLMLWLLILALFGFFFFYSCY